MKVSALRRSGAEMSQQSSAIRRIVTTHDATGKAIVHADGAAPNVRVRPGTGIVATLLWTTPAVPATYTNTDRGNDPVATAPPPGGTVLRVVEFPPEATMEHDTANPLAAMGLTRDTAGRRATTHPHMHATDSVDYAIVIEGEIDMLLDDSEVHMKTGDIMVQQGTNHAWVNRGDRPCKIAFVLIDAAGAPIIATD
jgi:mannose-6-phosphate isomerase-like protein (cupin superfamily)